MNWKTGITPQTALQFDLLLASMASFWNNRHERYRESLACMSAVEQHPVRLSAFGPPGKEVGMRRQMISKTGYDDQRAKDSILRRAKQVLKVTLARIRADHPGVLPAHIRTVLSFAKLDYQNPDLPDDEFLMDITFEKRN